MYQQKFRTNNNYGNKRNKFYSEKNQKNQKKSENIFKKQPDKNKNEFILKENEFPEMIIGNNLEKETLNFKKIDFNEIVNNKEEDKINKRWLILNKENLEKRKKEKEIEINKNKEIDINKILKAHKQMIKNWEDFHNNENILLGDRSRFINNDIEIKEMIEEEEYIKKEIAEYNEEKKNKLNKELDNNELNEYLDFY